jgi:hypothetical protein
MNPRTFRVRGSFYAEYSYHVVVVYNHIYWRF